MTTHRESWANHTPLARRRHIHGKIRSLASDARAIGEPPLWAGTLILAAGLAVLIGGIILAGALA